MSLASRVRLQGLRAAARFPVGSRAAGPTLRRILVIRPDHLGDLLLATPAIQYLRDHATPAPRISLLAGPWVEGLIPGIPAVDDYLPLDFPGFQRRGGVATRPAGGLLAPYQLLVRTARWLGRLGFDAALVLRWDHWWGAMLAWAAGIPVRTGYATPETSPFLTQALDRSPGLPEPVQSLRLAAALLQQQLPEEPSPERYPLAWDVPPGGFAEAAAWRRQRGIEDPWMVLQPGAGAAVKAYPVEAFAAAVAPLVTSGQVRHVIVAGSAGEAGLVAAQRSALAAHGIQAHELAGPSLAMLAALDRDARLVLGIDSGGLHLAVAAGAPTLALYGPVDPAAFGPWGDPARHRVIMSPLPCAPCNRLDYTLAEVPGHPCLRVVPPSEITRRAGLLLRDQAPHRRD